MPEHGATESPDCLVERFGAVAELTAPEIDCLKDLQRRERVTPAGEELLRQGAEAAELFVMKSGWAHAYRQLGDGQRQVLEVLLPGDIVGSRQLGLPRALNYVVTLSDAVVCPVPRDQLKTALLDHPRLGQVLLEIGAREQAILVERIIDLGRRDAYCRLAHFFVEIAARLATIRQIEGLDFRFPISQAVLADALGMSKVHVNRTLQRLRAEGLIELRSGAPRTARLCDLDGLIAAAQFEAFYLNEAFFARHRQPAGTGATAASGPARSA